MASESEKEDKKHDKKKKNKKENRWEIQMGRNLQETRGVAGETSGIICFM